MPRAVQIHVEHLTRVEGHGDIVLDVRSGKVKRVEWRVTEAPRFFEAFVRGKPYHQVAQITARICGICSIGHTLASLKATEAAMGIEVSAQSQALRRLAMHAENLQSHVLHIGYLVAPDLFGVGSVFPLIDSRPDAVRKIIELHRVANEMSDLICGRTTHPINLVPGGVWSTPPERQLDEMRRKLEALMPACEAVGELLLAQAGALPNFSRDTEYIALVAENEYALYDGMVGSTDTDKLPVEDYAKVVNEFVVPHSTAKYCRHNRAAYMVGALARLNLNARHLRPRARQWASRFGLTPVCSNPFMNTVAQLVECVHSIEDAAALLDGLLSSGVKNEGRPKVKPKAGRAAAAVEVPRGTLFHEYAYDEDGICTKANCVIPTNQNHNNIQQDLEAFAPTLLDKPEGEIELHLEMLVRAYDPCISCSTHCLRVECVR